MRFLHLHSSFHAGGKELRAARLINAFGPDVAHEIVSAMPEALGAASAIAPGLQVAFPRQFPSLAGKPLPGRLLRLARAMQGFDLVLTYNWGAMDAVMAHRLFARALGLPPLVHHEDGFNEDEALRLKPARNFYRRVALAGASALVVPSRRLEEIALTVWHQPRARVYRVANGIETAACAMQAAADAVPGLRKSAGEKWLGTLAGLRAVKNLPRLVRAFAALPDDWRLVVLGEGPERAAIKAEAQRCGVDSRVHLPGFVADPVRILGLFDLFALSSDSEQFPISVVEAMAAGLAVVSTDVGDVPGMVSADNRRFVVPAADEPALACALRELAADTALRSALGKANRVLARAEYDETGMIAAYRQIYGNAAKSAVPD